MSLTQAEIDYQRVLDLERDLTADEVQEILDEPEVEKSINPVGFIPGDALEEAVVRAMKEGSLTELTLTMADREKYNEDLAALHEWLQSNRPCRYFMPNVGQEKALLPLKTIDPNVPEVLEGVFGGANMVGKTTAMAAPAAVGIIWGRSELHPFFEDWAIFEKFESVRKKEKRALRGRIICHAGGMEDGGQVMEEITRWWPKGLYKWEKNHKSYYSVCKCWDMDGNLLAIINVRTHDQPRNAHAGHTLDFILGDEPLPKTLFAENHARLRQKMGGLLWLFLSPLDEASWIQDMLVNSPDVHFTQAMIWDNCVDWHPHDAMWSGGQVGKGQVLTRGHVARKVIQSHIRAWEMEGPEIAKARAYGEFTHFAGAVFKNFDATVHVVDPFPVPPNWPVYQIVDPHDGRPHFAIWACQGPDAVYLFAVSPHERWDKIRGGVAIPDACERWRAIEARFRTQVILRGGDPQKIKSPVAGRTLTSQGEEFAAEGFTLVPGENDISVGLSRIRAALAHDPTVSKKPKLFIMRTNPYNGDSNENLYMAFLQFCYKSTANETSNNRNGETLFVQTWKDPIDDVRYLYSLLKPWAPVSHHNRPTGTFARAHISRLARPWARR